MNSCVIWTVSLLEVIYIVYMFNYFKTTLEIHHPLEMLITSSFDWLKHPMGTGLYENKICPVGNFISLILASLIIYRAIMLDTIDLSLSISVIKMYSLIMTIIVFMGSILTNMNAWIYLFPIYLLEWTFIMN